MIRIITLLIILLSSLQQIYPQKGIFKKGKAIHLKKRDTLNASFIDSRIYVDVEIKNKVYKFFLDTGANTSFSKNIFDDFKLIEKDTVWDVHNNSKVLSEYEIPELKIGNTIYKNTIGALKDFSEKSPKIDGVLGSNIMCKGVWDFDMRNNQIIVSKKTSQKDFNNFYTSKIKLDHQGTPYLKTTYYNTIIDDYVEIDFGFNGLYTTSYYFFKNIKNKTKKIIEGYGYASLGAFGYGKPTKSYCFLLDLNIGNFKMKDIWSDIDENDYDDSTIGAELLIDNRVILDFTNKKIHIKPYPKIEEETPSQDSFGISLNDVSKKNTLSVSHLWKHLDASKKGIRFGDKIYSISGKYKKVYGNDIVEFEIIDPKDINPEYKIYEDSSAALRLEDKLAIQIFKINETTLRYINDFILNADDKITLEVKERGNFIELEKQAFYN